MASVPQLTGLWPDGDAFHYWQDQAGKSMKNRKYMLNY